MSPKIRIAVIALAVAPLLALGTAALAAPVALAAHGTTKTLTDRSLKATVTIPKAWKTIPYLGSGSFGYTGRSGWIELNASDESRGLRHTCRMAAAGTASIATFGKHPHIAFRKIDRRPGCLIMPSRDAPRWAEVKNGPKFQEAEALVTYRRPIHDDGRWPLLVIYANPARIKSIVRTVRVHH
jgi:hypothetical protein